jgi:hypothetical protein
MQVIEVLVATSLWGWTNLESAQKHDGMIMGLGTWSGEERKNELPVLNEQKTVLSGDLAEGVLSVMISVLHAGGRLGAMLWSMMGLR